MKTADFLLYGPLKDTAMLDELPNASTLTNSVLINGSLLRPFDRGDVDIRLPGAHLRLKLAYGKWTTDVGREVVYNRRYRPIWERWPGGSWEVADYGEFVDRIVSHAYFYNDGNTRRQAARLAREAMRALGIPLEGHKQWGLDWVERNAQFKRAAHTGHSS